MNISYLDSFDCFEKNISQSWHWNKCEWNIFKCEEIFNKRSPWIFWYFDSFFVKLSVQHDDATTYLSISSNFDISFDSSWGHSLVDNGEWERNKLKYQERFLHFSKDIIMFSKIKGEQIFTTIQDRKMTYKLESLRT